MTCRKDLVDILDDESPELSPIFTRRHATMEVKDFDFPKTPAVNASPAVHVLRGEIMSSSSPNFQQTENPRYMFHQSSSSSLRSSDLASDEGGTCAPNISGSTIQLRNGGKMTKSQSSKYTQYQLTGEPEATGKFGKLDKNGVYDFSPSAAAFKWDWESLERLRKNGDRFPAVFGSPPGSYKVHRTRLTNSPVPYKELPQFPQGVPSKNKGSEALVFSPAGEYEAMEARRRGSQLKREATQFKRKEKEKRKQYRERSNCAEVVERSGAKGSGGIKVHCRVMLPTPRGSGNSITRQYEVYKQARTRLGLPLVSKKKFCRYSAQYSVKDANIVPVSPKFEWNDNKKKMVPIYGSPAMKWDWNVIHDLHGRGGDIDPRTTRNGFKAFQHPSHTFNIDKRERERAGSKLPLFPAEVGSAHQVEGAIFSPGGAMLGRAMQRKYERSKKVAVVNRGHSKDEYEDNHRYLLNQVPESVPLLPPATQSVLNLERAQPDTRRKKTRRLRDTAYHTDAPLRFFFYKKQDADLPHVYFCRRHRLVPVVVSFQHFFNAIIWIVAAALSPSSGYQGFQGRRLAEVSHPIYAKKGWIAWGIVLALIATYELLRFAVVFSPLRRKKMPGGHHEDLKKSCLTGWGAAVSAIASLSLLGFVITVGLTMAAILKDMPSYDLPGLGEALVEPLSSKNSITQLMYCLALLHTAVGSGYAVSAILNAIGPIPAIAVTKDRQRKVCVTIALLLPGIVGWLAVRLAGHYAARKLLVKSPTTEPLDNDVSIQEFLMKWCLIFLDIMDVQGYGWTILWWLGITAATFIVWDFTDLAISVASDLYRGTIHLPTDSPVSWRDEGIVKGVHASLVSGPGIWNLPVNAAMVAVRGFMGFK